MWRAAAILVALAAVAAAWWFFTGGDGFPLGSSGEPSTSAPEATTTVSGGTLAGYADPAVCAQCHQNVWETYQHTGMARSFYRPTLEKMVEDFRKANTYYHPASDQHFTMIERDGKYFQRRHQIGPNGAEINVVEKEIHWVMGSGNHARTYLHQAPHGALIQLPLGWYSEKGGYWAMNPGYDQPGHEGFRREIGHDCMFCHNAYPAMEPGSDAYASLPVFPANLPEGIDCQRCHGPGLAHVEAARAKKPSLQEIRESVVNPANLSAERQMEVCMQCHLETNSRPLPYAIPRVEKGAFSYRPGEPLQNYILHFDRAGGTQDFEIAHAAYRLRMSACFAQSEALTCVTCHDPHHAKRGQEATAHYDQVCLSCHQQGKQAAITRRHPADSNCQSCHMPKRRTNDAVHVVMTDHWIQHRPPTRNLTAPVAENHTADPQGEVVFYHPKDLPESPDRDLYLGVAQVTEQSNLIAGIERLKQAIDRHAPPQAEFYYELAQAYRNAGQLDAAVAMFEEALRRKPQFLPTLVRLGEAHTQRGDFAKAVDALEQAVRTPKPHPSVLAELSAVYLKANRLQDAEQTARRALAIDPDSPTANNILGMSLAALGNVSGADAAYREAIRIDPRHADAHYNRANLLAMQQQWNEAIWHYQRAIQASPDFAEAHYNLGATLGMHKKYREAAHHFRQAIRVNPEYYAAHLNLGNLEWMNGNRSAAREHFEKAAGSPDEAIRSAASRALGGSQ
jgi:predicted CXXCH cytochrome family protein